jgi:hypothetical protein
MNLLIYLLEYNYGANRTLWSIYDVNQWIVLYRRVYVKPSKKNTWTIRKRILTWFNTCDLLITKKRIDQVLLLSIRYLWKELDHKKKVFKNESMEDMKWFMRHDGSWRRINKDLTMMNHASEKSKRESWRRGTGCDGEGQVDVWIRGIKLAMRNHISLSVNLYWIKI